MTPREKARAKPSIQDGDDFSGFNHMQVSQITAQLNA